jgi:alpha-1,3/alpha-1,6-mannosyltransferase
VNSVFTSRVFAATFSRLAARGVRPAVLYPAVALPPLADLRSAPTRRSVAALARVGVAGVPQAARVLLSINRFERKKGLPLALRCLADLRRRSVDYADLHLVLAGGYDPRLEENVTHLAELRALADALGVAAAVTLVPSFSDEQKSALLAAASLVLYTPEVCACAVAAPGGSSAALTVPHRTSTLAWSRLRPWPHSAR